MSAVTLNTKILLRTDTKANWESKNPVLKLGEIAIVRFDDDYNDIKIGNGISAFNSLSYLYQNEIKTDKITGKDLFVKSIAQGYNVKATPTSLATGIYSEANGNFNVVHGIEAKAKEGDNYAFVYNGQNLPLDGKNFYESHGEGTFNVNSLNGLNGFYIGERSLSSILHDYLLSSQMSEYYKKNETSSDALLNVALATKANVNAIPTKTSQLQNDSNFLTAHLSLTAYETKADLTANYYKKTELSTASQTSDALSLKADKTQIPSLSGVTYDMSKNGEFTKMVVDLISCLGGTVINNPLEQ